MFVGTYRKVISLLKVYDLIDLKEHSPSDRSQLGRVRLVGAVDHDFSGLIGRDVGRGDVDNRWIWNKLDWRFKKL